MIPAEAVEAAVLALAAKYDPLGAGEHSGEIWNRMVADVQIALEAAAPHMPDVMANRETNVDELAAEYRRGYRYGLADRKQVTK